jgi:hypothetical protein
VEFRPLSGCPSILHMFRFARIAVDRAGEGPAGPSNHEGSPFLTPEGYLDCFSRWDRRTQCSGWPS